LVEPTGPLLETTRVDGETSAIVALKPSPGNADLAPKWKRVVTTNGRIRLGQRVWVLTPENRRAYGEIASLPEPFLGTTGFVVTLDGKSTAVTCTEDRRGSQWDFADAVES
jgi:hypothetical protein